MMWKVLLALLVLTRGVCAAPLSDEQLNNTLQECNDHLVRTKPPIQGRPGTFRVIEYAKGWEHCLDIRLEFSRRAVEKAKIERKSK